MAGVIQKPDSLSLSGNLKKFILAGNQPVSFVLKKGDTVLLESEYIPGTDNLLDIDVKDIVESCLSYNINASTDTYVQTGLIADFVATIDKIDYSFRVIRCGVANLSDTAANWLKLHFLTWQPRVKEITYYSPEWLTYYAVDACSVKLKATYSDKTSRVITLHSCPAGTAVTLNVQYSVIAGKLGKTYPSYYEVWTEASGGTKLSESQVYAFSESLSENEQWYLFENSLGGLDTFRAYGTNNLNAEHEHNVAELGDVREEYQVDTERKYTKNTGYLDEYARRWMLDFFPSRAKYVYEATAIRKIVVTESNVTYVSSDLPSSYTFTWQLAEVSALLNLVKNESDIPDNLVAPDLSSPDFILPPRLSEYPRVQLTEGVLIPAFDPHNPKPTVTTFGAIHDTIKNSVIRELEDELASIGGGGDNPGGGCDLEIIELNDLGLILPTDKNVYSALSTDFRIAEEINDFLIDINGMYLRKDIDDTAHGIITFDNKIGSTVFIDGWDGKGWEITAPGAALFDSLRIRNDLFIGGRMGSPSFASGFPEGWGWDLAPYKRINSAGIEETKYRLEIDDIVARNSLRVYEMIISQLRGENDNVIFAGQMKVAYYDSITGRLYLDTEGGVLYNPFRQGDLLMVQRYNGMPSADNDYYVTKQYELQVTEVGIGSLSDGEDRLDWITFKNFVGDISLIAQKDVLTRVDSATDSTRKGVVKITTIDELGTPHISALFGMKTNPTDCILARMGNCSSIRTKSGIQLNETVGFYARGAHLEYSTIILNTGETIEQTFSVMDGKFESTIAGIKNDMSLETGNILRNSSFGRDTNYWVSANTVRFVNVAGQFLWVSGSFYVEKSAVADIYNDAGRNVLRIRNTAISQLNGIMSIPTRSETSEEGYAYSFAFYVKVLRSGTLTAGVSDTPLFIEQQLSATESYQKISKFGKWDELGDFQIQFTGEILIYGVSLFNDALADAQIKLQTQIDQSNEHILLKADKDYVDAETGEIYVHYDSQFLVTAEQISGVSTRVDNINNKINTAGWITTADGNRLYATVSTVSSLTGRVSTAESSISNNAYSITQKVSFTDYNGKTVISMVNQTADSYKIDAKNINLNGKVTISMFDPVLTNNFNGKVNSSAIGSLAYKNKVEKAELGTTVLDGGKIITSLIDTDSIFANMASIGGFTIENGSLFSDKYTTGLANGQFFLYSKGNNGFLGFSASNVWAGIGLNVLPASLGGIRALLRLENNVASAYNTNYGALIEARNGEKNRALECIGGVRIKGAVATARICIAGSKTDTIVNNIGYKDVFVYQVSKYLRVILPSSAQVKAGFGQIYADYNDSYIDITNSAWIEITILNNRWSTDHLSVEGVSGTPLIDGNGNVANESGSPTGAYGSVVLAKGDCIKLAFHNNQWYRVSVSN